MNKKIQMLGLCALLAFLVVFPLVFSDPVITTIAIFTLIMMAAATGWNLFSGYTRYLSLGHATFYGFGAYILAAACQIWHLPGGLPPLFVLPLIGLVTGLFSLPLGWIALQTRHYTFIVITIAIFSLMSLLPNLLSGILPQINQIFLPLPPWDATIFNVPFYYTALLLSLCALAVSWAIRSSKFGLCLLAISDDEDRAWGLGNTILRYKLIAWAISAVFVGMAGALNAYFLGSLDPASAFSHSFNVALPVTAFIGGVGTLIGPLLGAILTIPIQQYLTLQYGNTPGLDLILYGALLLVVILILPQGIGPVIRKHVLARITFFKFARSNSIPALDFNDFAETPAFAVHSGVSYAMRRESISTELIGEFTPHSTSVPLSITRGYQRMKSGRLVPLSQETVADNPDLSHNNGA